MNFHQRQVICFGDRILIRTQYMHIHPNTHQYWILTGTKPEHQVQGTDMYMLPRDLQQVEEKFDYVPTDPNDDADFEHGGGALHRPILWIHGPPWHCQIWNHIRVGVISYTIYCIWIHSGKPMKSWVYDFICWTHDIIVQNLWYHTFHFTSDSICIWYCMYHVNMILYMILWYTRRYHDTGDPSALDALPSLEHSTDPFRRLGGDHERDVCAVWASGQGWRYRTSHYTLPCVSVLIQDATSDK